MEAREIEKIVAALRCTGLSEKCDSCDYGYHLCQDSDCNDACDNERLDKDAAAAIEALQAQLPKRGEWIIHGEPPMLVIECSVCGQKYFNHVMQEKAKYCSMCGAKMEVQDDD